MISLSRPVLSPDSVSSGKSRASESASPSWSTGFSFSSASFSAEIITFRAPSGSL